MARSYMTVALAAANALDAIERGELGMPKGIKAMGLVLRISAPVENTGGAPADFTDDELLALLGKISLVRADYGKDGKFAAPYVDRTLRELEAHRRRCYRTELDFDTVTIGAGATETIAVEWILPLGKFDAWFSARDKNRWGMGRSQLRSFRAEFRRSATDAIVGNFQLDGGITITVDVDAVPTKGDVWNPVPHVYFTTDNRDAVPLPEGLPLAIDELSSTYGDGLGPYLSNFSLKIDEAVIHEQTHIDNVRAERRRTALYTEAAEVSRLGGVTLYETNTGEAMFAELLTGAPEIRQDSKTIANMSIRYTYVPITDADSKKLRAEVAAVATETRKKPIKAISGAVNRGEALPVRLQPYAGLRFVDKRDREYEEAPGLSAAVGSNAAVPEVPALVLERARAIHDAHDGKGEKMAAEGVVNALASAIPGVVASGRGFSEGDTSARDLIRREFFKK